MDYSNLVLPNLDKVCNSTSTQSVSLGITTTNFTEQCSDPLNYYKGYGIDLIIIFVFTYLIIRILALRK